MALILSVVCITAAPFAEAGTHTCAVSSAGPYCQFTGKVARAYVNESNTILLYFDTPLDLNQPADVGIEGVTIAGAAAYPQTDNPEFGKMLYASMLAAQARGATIVVQMRGRYGGYLRMDRIWVYQ